MYGSSTLSLCNYYGSAHQPCSWKSGNSTLAFYSSGLQTVWLKSTLPSPLEMSIPPQVWHLNQAPFTIHHRPSSACFLYANSLHITNFLPSLLLSLSHFYHSSASRSTPSIFSAHSLHSLAHFHLHPIILTSCTSFQLDLCLFSFLSVQAHIKLIICLCHHPCLLPSSHFVFAELFLWKLYWVSLFYNQISLSSVFCPKYLLDTECSITSVGISLPKTHRHTPSRQLL